MGRRLRTTVKVFGVLLLLTAVALGLFWWALRHEPQFYREAIRVDREVYEKASDEMIRRTMALQNSFRREGRWEAVFTAEQINGWLAVDLVENHPDTLPDSLRDPRVAIEPNRLLLACRLNQGGASSVVSLAIEPDVPEPNVFTLRIMKARAGALPVPLDDVLDQITEATARAGFHLHWRQADGDPVAVVSLSALYDEEDRAVQIESLQLADGEIRLQGTTRQRSVVDGASQR